MNEHRTTSAAGYQEDFYAWTQRQAKLLRSLERLGAELPVEIDLSHVAEEIEGLGSADLNSVKSFIRQILVHLIKATSDPAAKAVSHWRTEATTFQVELLDRYTPSMRQLIDMQALWDRAMKLASLVLSEHGRSVAPGIPSECPYSVADMIADEFNFDELLARLREGH